MATAADAPPPGGRRIPAMVLTCRRHPKVVLSDEDVAAGFTTCLQCRAHGASQKAAKISYPPCCQSS